MNNIEEGEVVRGIDETRFTELTLQLSDGFKGSSFVICACLLYTCEIFRNDKFKCRFLGPTLD